ncbi:MAG: hypothetical protein PUE33_04730 [bacterium]|nr:hypothetical protein [bacterium]
MPTKMGRPEIKIKKEDFEKLCALQCTEEEIAGFYDCSVDTINNWCKKTYDETFSETYKKKSAKGKMSLRRYQMKLAERNASMAIFLGKQYLGQRDVIETGTPEELDKVKELLGKLDEEASNVTNG